MMSIDNNKSSTSAPLAIQCYYNSKWEKWYWKLIETRQLLNRPIPSRRGNKNGLEKHHVVPSCMGGADENSNYIMLTIREHFVAHLLLSLAFPKDVDLWWSIWKSSKQWELNSRQYEMVKSHLKASEDARRKNREWHLNHFKDKNNHPFTGKSLTDEHKAKISKTVSEKVKGIKNPRARKELWSRFEELFEVWNNLGRPGIRNFAKHLGLKDSYVAALVRNFRKMI